MQMEVKDFIASQMPKYQPTVGETLMSPSDYAKKVGLTASAVRIQLQRGMLDGVKMGKHWKVRIVDPTAVNTYELTQLKLENEVLKTKLSLICSIVGKETLNELKTYD